MRSPYLLIILVWTSLLPIVEGELLLRRRTQEEPPQETSRKIWHGVPRILWIFLGLALGVICLLLFGRRKLPDFSEEANPLLLSAGSADEAEPSHHSEEGDKLEEIAAKPDYQSTADNNSEEERRTTRPSGGPEFVRQTTNPAGLMARPAYNPTGIYNGLFGRSSKPKRERKSRASRMADSSEESNVSMS